MHVFREDDVHDFVAKAMVIASSLSSAVRPWEIRIYTQDAGSSPPGWHGTSWVGNTMKYLIIFNPFQLQPFICHWHIQTLNLYLPRLHPGVEDSSNIYAIMQSLRHPIILSGYDRRDSNHILSIGSSTIFRRWLDLLGNLSQFDTVFWGETGKEVFGWQKRRFYMRRYCYIWIYVSAFLW